jgi:F-type H+-transporting ATPase subunit epsilon
MLHLSLVTPAKKFVTDVPIEEVFVPTATGELNILEGHAPLMAMLDTGILRYRLQGQKALISVAISWGYLEVSKDRVTVLAETAETADVIDINRAKAAREKAEKALTAGDLEYHQFRKYQLKLERAIIRTQLATEGREGISAEKRDTTH